MSAVVRGDIFVDLAPRSLLSRRREFLDAFYAALRTDAAPTAHRDVEKLWAVFDAALETEHVEFLHRYLEEVCFSPELIPFSPEAYLHSTHVILDWCQKFHSDAELQILEFRHDTLLHLPKRCDSMMAVLQHCLSHRGGDPGRLQKRQALVQKLLKTTEGTKLAALVACWRRYHDNSLSERREHLSCLPPDAYLNSQSLPPMWLEHYPFQDEAKMMEIVFLNKEDLSNVDLKHSKLALLGFYLLHSGQVTSLDFLPDWFGVDQRRAEMWQGLFLADLCVLDHHFQEGPWIEQAVHSLKDSAAQLQVVVPIDTLLKLQALGCWTEAKELFLSHLPTYLRMLPCPLGVARQGLVFCLSSGDVAAGLEVARQALQHLQSAADGIVLLRHFFDQVLGSTKLENLVMLDLTGMEEAVFVDWAGNKRGDPECCLYLVLYFFRQSKLQAARQLYELNAVQMQHSVHKELWNQFGQILRKEPLMPVSASTAAAVVEMSETSGDEEVEDDIQELLAACFSCLPPYVRRLLRRSLNSGPQLMPSFSEMMDGTNLCPLHPAREAEAQSHFPTVGDEILDQMDGNDSEAEVFYDAMETLEE